MLVHVVTLLWQEAYSGSILDDLWQSLQPLKQVERLLVPRKSLIVLILQQQRHAAHIHPHNMHKSKAGERSSGVGFIWNQRSLVKVNINY